MRPPPTASGFGETGNAAAEPRDTSTTGSRRYVPELLVDKYELAASVWFDWWIAQTPRSQTKPARSSRPSTTNRGKGMGQGCAINYKKHGGESFPDTAGGAGHPSEVQTRGGGPISPARLVFWQNDTLGSVSKTSWGYVSQPRNTRPSTRIVERPPVTSRQQERQLLPPEHRSERPTAPSPEPEEKMLREIGQWLAR
jgi:hypothetical protein